MTERVNNPFTVTKAVDLSDKEILSLWVDFSSHGETSLINFIKPTSKMPMFIVGGKGSGKTHLMRYISYNIQKIVYGDKFLDKIIADGFMGIYVRCGGLNASRFSGKNLSDNEWTVIFSYYMELWVSHILLLNIQEIISENEDLDKNILFCTSISNLSECSLNFKNIGDILSFLEETRKKVDYFVNNCVFEKLKAPEILFTRGKLLFGIPNYFNKLYVKNEKSIIFQYLFDEFENFTKEQQIYINTLLREREEHHKSSFRIGARLYGIKTHLTLSAEEENKEGSEFDKANLDKRMYGDEYNSFAEKIINKRLDSISKNINEFNFENNNLIEDSVNKYFESKPLGERKYFSRFNKNIVKIVDKNTWTVIHDYFNKTKSPLQHKFVIYLIYKMFSKHKQFSIVDFETLLDGLAKDTYKNTYGHFKSDLQAQLYVEADQTIPYGGTFLKLIELSMGNPRHLLIILKYIYDWAIYRGEVTESSLFISQESQDLGILDASKWFFNDAKLIGEFGEHVHNSINKLCKIFKLNRFSDKPSETSISTFSINEGMISENARRTIEIAEKWSLVIRERNHKAKSSGEEILKFQINTLLAPKWSLPTSKRGTLQLNSNEANAIFDSDYKEKYESFYKNRKERLNFPFSASRTGIHADLAITQASLLGGRD